MSFATSVSTPQTLTQRLAQGRLPVMEALRYCMLLADALRKLHDSGRVHGAVSPALIALDRNNLELMPPSGREAISPYTAPEIIEGRPADSRSDIFSFGAILYEILTGRLAFKADTPELLSAAIVGSAPTTTGSPAVDRLVTACLAKDPAARLQRIQKVILELRLLAVAAQREEAAIPSHRDEVAHAELEQLEARLAARLTPIENGFNLLTDRVAGLKLDLQAAGQRWEGIQSRCSGTEQILRVAAERVDRFDRRATSIEQAVNNSADYIERLEHTVESLGHDSALQREALAQRIELLEQALRIQADAVESARTAIAQTDDLVEHVVEALESIQSLALEHTGDGTPAGN